MAGVGDYDPTLTDLCERMLVTVIGNAGFWGQRLYLVGGLVPRYLCGPTPAEAPAHEAFRRKDLAEALAASIRKAAAPLGEVRIMHVCGTHEHEIGRHALRQLLPKNVELILTGRNAKPELLERADLVTEMRKVKHPYDKGTKARKGLDY